MQMILDNNGFVHIAEDPKYLQTKNTLFAKIRDGSVSHTKTFEFIEELFLLQQHNRETYTTLLREYVGTVNGRFLLPWNKLMQLEIEKRRPLSQNEKYLNAKDAVYIQELLLSGRGAVALQNQIENRKSDYEKQMNVDLDQMLADLESAGHSSKDIRVGFKGWYSQIDRSLQDRFESSLSIKGVHYTELPFTKAFLHFFACRHFETILFIARTRKTTTTTVDTTSLRPRLVF